jgi:hypothetical protein
VSLSQTFHAYADDNTDKLSTADAVPTTIATSDGGDREVSEIRESFTDGVAQEGLNGIAVVKDIRPSPRFVEDGPESSPPAHTPPSRKDDTHMEFLAMHPRDEGGAGGREEPDISDVLRSEDDRARALSPADIQKQKLLALHGKATREGGELQVQQSPKGPDGRVGGQEDAGNGPRLRNSKSMSAGFGEKKGGKRAVRLSVTIAEPSEEETSYRNARGSASCLFRGKNTSARRTARDEVEAMFEGLPVGAVLLVNRLVVKAQAQIRYAVPCMICCPLHGTVGGLCANRLVVTNQGLHCAKGDDAAHEAAVGAHWDRGLATQQFTYARRGRDPLLCR